MNSLIDSDTLNKAISAIASLFDSTCNVEACISSNSSSPRTSVFYEQILQGIPCRVSYKSSSLTSESANTGETQANITATLYLPPNTNVPPGSRIYITRASSQDRSCSTDKSPELWSNSSITSLYFTHSATTIVKHR